jgi:hypothetical protein
MMSGPFRAGKNVAKIFRTHGLLESSVLTTRKPLETRAIAERDTRMFSR